MTEQTIRTLTLRIEVMVEKTEPVDVARLDGVVAATATQLSLRLHDLLRQPALTYTYDWSSTQEATDD